MEMLPTAILVFQHILSQSLHILIKIEEMVGRLEDWLFPGLRLYSLSLRAKLRISSQFICRVLCLLEQHLFSV